MPLCERSKPSGVIRQKTVDELSLPGGQLALSGFRRGSPASVTALSGKTRDLLPSSAPGGSHPRPVMSSTTSASGPSCIEPRSPRPCSSPTKPTQRSETAAAAGQARRGDPHLRTSLTEAEAMLANRPSVDRERHGLWTPVVHVASRLRIAFEWSLRGSRCGLNIRGSASPVRQRVRSSRKSICSHP